MKSMLFPKHHSPSVLCVTIVILVFILGRFSSSCQSQSFLIGGFGEGISASALASDGSMLAPKLLVEQVRPAFFTFHPKLDIVYCVTESMRNDAKAPSAITAYRFGRPADTNQMPTLTLLNSLKLDSDIPCHVSIDADGEFLVMSNYTSGSVVVCPVAADGSIKAASDNVQHKGTGAYAGKEPRAHCSAWDPSNRYVFVADLGLDRVLVYEMDRAKGKLRPAKNPEMVLPAGSGPRHIAIHPNKKWVYVINETALTMTAAFWDASAGLLKELQTTTTLPADTKRDGFSTAEVLVHPSGRFVYGSNRGHDTIASFLVDETTGKLSPIGHTSTNGKTPRNFRIAPDGAFLLAENQQSDSVVSFTIDLESGKLKSTGFSIQAMAPACIKFVPERK